MSREDEYLAVLSSAIAEVEAGSFEARGAVYDRLWGVVVEQIEADHADPEPVIARERDAFLHAIQTIEFGVRQSPVPPTNHQTFGSRSGHGRAIPIQPRDGRIARSGTRRRRPMTRRILWRMVSACAVLALLWLGYVLLVVQPDSVEAKLRTDAGAQSSWPARLTRVVDSIRDFFQERQEPQPIAGQRAVLYEESDATATGNTFSGRAVWRHTTEKTADEAAAGVLSIDVEIPQKKLILQITVKRAAAGGAISHFVEFKFLNPDRSFSDAVEDVLGILMKTDELSRGVALAGKVVKVQAGMFLMGLSGSAADTSRNLNLLKERPWLDVPIVLKDRSRSILAIEKGATGQEALNHALASWGQSG
jgi:hypothetical protein